MVVMQDAKVLNQSEGKEIIAYYHMMLASGVSSRS